MTKPRLFIIESLSLQDEADDLFEGGHLSKILRLSGSDCKYMYLRTKRELEEAIDLFQDSGYRYLHISCHGDKSGIGLSFDNLSFEELGQMLKPCLDRKRVFFSSCSVMNDRCAQSLLPGSRCYSVVGPARDVAFDRATAFWSAFYHLLLRDKATSIKHDNLSETVSNLQGVFGVHMRYYRASKTADCGFVRVELGG